MIDQVQLQPAVRQIQIFVVNLERSTDRKAAMAEKLARLGIDATFFHAVEGRKLGAQVPGYLGRLRRLLFGKDLTPGELGCAMSHFAIYRTILQRGLESALILEDDLDLSPNLLLVVKYLENCRDEWDMVRFLSGEKNRKGLRLLREVGPEVFLARSYGSPGGSHAYMVSQTGAKRLLKGAEKLWLPIDIFFGQIWFHRLRVRTVWPAPAWPVTQSESTIDGQRFEKPKPADSLERVLYVLTRPAYKLFDNIAKRLTWWLSWPKDRLVRRKDNAI